MAAKPRCAANRNSSAAQAFYWVFTSTTTEAVRDGLSRADVGFVQSLQVLLRAGTRRHKGVIHVQIDNGDENTRDPSGLRRVVFRVDLVHAHFVVQRDER